MLSADGVLNYFPGEDPKHAPLGTLNLGACAAVLGVSECAQWPDAPPSTRSDSRLALVMGSREYRLVCESPEHLVYWRSHLLAERARSRSIEMGEEIDADELLVRCPLPDGYCRLNCLMKFCFLLTRFRLTTRMLTRMMARRAKLLTPSSTTTSTSSAYHARLSAASFCGRPWY